jgi:hypothetical protein
MRKRNGRTLPFAFKAKGDSTAMIAERMAANATVHIDEAAHLISFMRFP